MKTKKKLNNFYFIDLEYERPLTAEVKDVTFEADSKAWADQVEEDIESFDDDGMKPLNFN